MSAKAAKKRILVIDDDASVLISLERLLENEGYETTTVWSGQEGLSMLRSNEFDMVLLDDYLRDITHEEIFKAIRRLEFQPLVVLTESIAEPGTAEHFFSLGGAAVVAKRAPCEEITAEIRKCFENATLETVIP